MKIPINPDILKWARQTAGMQTDEVAHKMGKDVDTILSWERGDGAPTYIQLEKLAYQYYKRPIALFFFPECPREETPKQSFRTLPEREIETMSSQMHYLLKQARAMQINLAELNDNVNPAKHNIVRDLGFQPETSAKTMAVQVRKYLGIELNTQFGWRDPDEALKSWRNSLEEHGVYVFKEAFKDESFSAYCLSPGNYAASYFQVRVCSFRLKWSSRGVKVCCFQLECFCREKDVSSSGVGFSTFGVGFCCPGVQISTSGVKRSTLAVEISYRTVDASCPAVENPTLSVEIST